MQSEDDQQQSMFSQSEHLEFFPPALMEEEILEPVGQFDYVEHYKHVHEKQQQQLFQDWGLITNEQKSSFDKFKQHNKYMSGIQGIVTLNSKEKTKQPIDAEMKLDRFFEQQAIQPLHIFQKALIPLSKVFTIVDMNLVGNFQNFTYIEKSNGHQFFQNWKEDYYNKLKYFMQRKSSVELFGDIFSWWLQGFQSMMLQIQKCSPLYTLNIFKKEKDNSNPVIILADISQKEMEEEPKQRRLWNRNELEMLNRLMDTHVTIPTSKIQQAANELGRSVLAVTSKIQKLQKQKKDKPINTLSLEKKMLIVLANNPLGLTKQQLLLKIQAQFQMGEEETWKKSVTQLLSVCKKITKSKGVFSFTSIPQLQPPTNFKNKVIACLYQLPNQRGNLKSITRKYIQKFFASDGLNPQDLQRVKITQDNIYKTIFKNDIFDKSNSKQIYRYIETDHSNKDSQSDRSESSSKSNYQ